MVQERDWRSGPIERRRVGIESWLTLYPPLGGLRQRGKAQGSAVSIASAAASLPQTSPRCPPPSASTPTTTTTTTAPSQGTAQLKFQASTSNCRHTPSLSIIALGVYYRRSFTLKATRSRIDEGAIIRTDPQSDHLRQPICSDQTARRKAKNSRVAYEQQYTALPYEPGIELLYCLQIGQCEADNTKRTASVAIHDRCQYTITPSIRFLLSQSFIDNTPAHPHGRLLRRRRTTCVID